MRTAPPGKNGRIPATHGARNRRGKTTPRRLAIVDRDIRALDLRRAGTTYQEIAHAIGLTAPSSAVRAVQRALRLAALEPAEDLVRLETERLDMMLAGIWPGVQAGNLACIDRALKISERRARLFGLDRTGPAVNVAVQQNVEAAAVNSEGDRPVQEDRGFEYWQEVVNILVSCTGSAEELRHALLGDGAACPMPEGEDPLAAC